MGIIFVIGLAVVLFTAAFLLKRRFGVLTFGLCAGFILSLYWTDGVAQQLQQQGIHLTMPPLEDAVSAGLIVAPALVLLVGGPKYQTIIPRLLGSLLFVVLAMVLLAEPLKAAIVLDQSSQKILDYAARYQQVALAGGVGLALLDTLTIRSKKKDESHKKKK